MGVGVVYSARSRLRRIGFCAAAATAAACVLSLEPLPAAERDDERHAVGTVRDLAYGEVLFHFYQQDYFNALVRLLAAFEREEVTGHAAEAELLLGGLYLSYGQHRVAGDIFERMLAEHRDSEVHDRAWFFLAKIWRQRGYFAEAEAALARIRGPLPAELEPERRHLAAELAMDQGRFDEAAATLGAFVSSDEDWLAYARYNLGVALVRQGRTLEGAEVLARIGTQRSSAGDDARAALRDRANVALGYAWLQAGEAELARPALQRVRLAGPFSTKALLGVGWADVELGEYRRALAPWLELKDRSVLDAAVQESLLAVPYAFTQLGADRQAADHYLDAIAAFDAEIERIDRSRAAVVEGALVAALAGGDSPGTGWYWRLDSIPDTPESHYLYELLSTHPVQEALKNYRDIVVLIRNLDERAASLAAFDDILETRRLAFLERLPPIEARLDRLDLERMSARRVELESLVAAIERARDPVALGTPEQQELWRELSVLEPKLARLPQDASGSAMRDKQRFLKGLLQWELERDYKLRLWEQKTGLRRLDLELKEAQARRYRIMTAKAAWPDEHDALTARIATLEPRTAALREAAYDVLGRQQRFIEQLALDELEARRERLAVYRVQARFSLAAIYDRAAASASAAPSTADAAAEDSR